MGLNIAPLHQDLCWLDVTERVNYKLGMLMHRCLLHKALKFLHVGICAPLYVIS